MPPVADTLATITHTTTGTFTPPHQITDRAKVTALAHDMAEHGWAGAPLVTEGGSGGNAYTGTHRLAAAAHLCNTDGIEIHIEHIDISDLCELYGIDWSALVHHEHGGDTYQAASALRHLLPSDVVDYLGFDVDGEA